MAFAARLRTGTPYLCWAHGEEVNFSNSETRPRWYQRRIYSSQELGLMVGVVLRGARAVVASSPNTRDILIESAQFDLENTELHDVVFPQIDLEWWSD